MRLASPLLALFIALPAIPASADSLTDLLPPDTRVVFGVRVHNLAISTIAQTFAAQAHSFAAGWLKAVSLDGINFLRDIDEVLLATSGKSQTAPALVVVTGHFDVARLTAGATHYYRKVPFLTADTPGNSAVALLDSSTALLGDPNLVRAAIDQRGGAARIDVALNDRITSMRQRYDIWGLGDLPDGFGAPGPQAQFLESIDRFQFGAQLASGLEVSAEIHARSTGDVKKLNETFGFLAAILKGAKAQGGARFNLETEGGTLKLSIFIPDAELKKAIQAQAASLSPVSIGKSKAALPVTAPAEITPSPEVSAPAPVPAVAETAAPGQAKPAAHNPEKDTVVFTLPGKK